MPQIERSGFLRTTCTSPLQTHALTQVILYILLSSETNRLGKTTNYYYNDRGNSDWQDELTSVNGTPLTYDANGNVLTYGNMEFEWTNGRVLSQITVNPEDPNGTADVYSYTYDESGIRSSKTVNGVTTYFTTKDGVILSQTDGTNTMYFQYDNSGNPAGFLYNGAQYFYLTNQMGDVIGITDNTGSLIATYTYGAWGEVLAVTPATANSPTQLAIANANPLRYRGYYLDQETGYYYLQSRYYSPSLARFINADNAVVSKLTISDAAGTNLYAYCSNDPVNNSDVTGYISRFFPRPEKARTGFGVGNGYRFLSRPYCLAYAAYAIGYLHNTYPKKYKSKYTCLGMGVKRIAVELWAHAVGYYFGKTIRIIAPDLSRKLRHSGWYIDVNYDDNRVKWFYLLWGMASAIKWSAFKYQAGLARNIVL